MQDRSWTFIGLILWFILLLWVFVTVYDAARANYLEPPRQTIERNEFGHRLDDAARQRQWMREW